MICQASIRVGDLRDDISKKLHDLLPNKLKDLMIADAAGYMQLEQPQNFSVFKFSKVLKHFSDDKNSIIKVFIISYFSSFNTLLNLKTEKFCGCSNCI